MSTNEFYSDLKAISCDFASGRTTKAMAASQIVEWLSRLDEAARGNQFSKAEKNRHFVLLLQHLSLICRSPGPSAWINRFQRGTLLLNAKPVVIISGVDFSGLILPELNLINTTLIACTFDGADLRKSRFGGRYGHCTLLGCSFRRADLSFADFRRSSLYGCDFEGANTRSTKGHG
jgi:uncharacterized protein YjbI with pentapeptide repeats